MTQTSASVAGPGCCDLCSSTARDFLFSSLDGDYVRCSDCGLIYGIADEQGLPQLYDSFYEEEASEGVPQVRRPARWHAKIAERLERLAPYRRTGRFLEIGSAFGDFLSVVAQSGWDAVGIELSDTAARFARDRRGLDVRTGTIETIGADLPRGAFDVVYADNLLEHVVSPASFLAGVEQLLRPGGVLIASTLNAASWAYRLTGKDWEYVMYARVHRFVFTPELLGRYCANQNLSIEHTETYGFRLISKYAPRRWYYPLVRPVEKVLAKAAEWTGQGHGIEIWAVKNESSQSPSARAA